MAFSAKTLARLMGRRRSSFIAGRSPEKLTGLHTPRINAAAQIGSPVSHALGDGGMGRRTFIGRFPCSAHSRWFLGVGDGEEGDVLCRSYEERVVMGYVWLLSMLA
ncbi:hypothetical protein KSP40_PGU013535 [Platanthera guangdongensis]|uniref:Uncharacterized protein n=1 Tax=Platanthera guangdongensis TaxID=2320717 RepID=A0ABR2MXD7_9ASPA